MRRSAAIGSVPTGRIGQAVPNESTDPVNAAFFGLAFTAALNPKLLGADQLIREPPAAGEVHLLPGDNPDRSGLTRCRCLLVDRAMGTLRAPPPLSVPRPSGEGLEKVASAPDQWPSRLSWCLPTPNVLNRSSMTVEQFIADLDELVRAVFERVGGKQDVIFGHSWGSALGVLYAAEGRELCRQRTGR